jgi:hypothetical protein
MILVSVPDELLDGLPPEDQDAIRSAVGGIVHFVELREDGKMEVEFRYNGDIHTIWVAPEFCRA